MITNYLVEGTEEISTNHLVGGQATGEMITSHLVGEQAR